MAEVVLKEVCKNYGKVEAVKNVNLKCEDGQFMCLLGPSGCGKSSTLRMIAGLEQITKGEIYIGDGLVNAIPPKDRNIAMVFETYALYPHLSVYGNIAFPLKIRNFSKSQIDKKVKEVAEMLDMNDFLSKRVRGLGDGQKQRVSIARALVREPEVFLMDEPISHLDAKLRTRMRGELKRLQKETGITCVYVTHDQIEAMALGDKIAVMNFGVLQQVGTPQEVYDHPVTESVAGFIGEPPMNFLDCAVAREKGDLLLLSPSFKIYLPNKIKKTIEQKGVPSEVLMGVRPTDIEVSREKSDPESIRAEVYTIEPRGDGLVLTVKLGKNLVRVECAEEFKSRTGDTIWLNPEKERIHLFDKSTGVSLI
ncbi:ABC transporter ATP-binding protein [Candidatus Aerophobetes bacterium]|uniref:ABC transporter ATP-binding protein n=2 Tax=root TaxID=1 RepID=A0A523TFW7_UNCAE|nr:MAG: ABC transporter ATP-binding protein [Candidatus Aerophobetes bacterium]